MTIKGNISKSEHVDWKYIPLTIQKLEINKKYKMCLVVTFGSFFGLRLKSILNLRWGDVLNKESFQVEEKNKIRTIFIIDDIRHLINRIYLKLGSPELDNYILLNNTGKQVLSPQYVNKQVKLLFTKYEIPYHNLSSDSFLKTFCIKFLETKNSSIEAKKWISNILGHASWSITANFLGYYVDSDDKHNYNTFSMNIDI